MESLTASDQESPELESMRLVAGVTAELSAIDWEEILRFAQFLWSTKSNDET